MVKTYCGHGIGELFHTVPTVPHYPKNKAKGVMKPGHIFTIEPMINLGTWQASRTPCTPVSFCVQPLNTRVEVLSRGYQVVCRTDARCKGWARLSHQRVKRPPSPSLLKLSEFF